MRVFVLLTLVIGIMRFALEWDRATARRLRRRREVEISATPAPPAGRVSRGAKTPLRVQTLHAAPRRLTGTD